MRRSLQLFVALTAAACSGQLSERSVVPIEGVLPIPTAATQLRLEVENGTVEIQVAPAREVHFRGAVRRAGDTPEQLQRFEARGTEIVLQPDPAASGTYVLRTPTRPPAEEGGVLAVEMKLEIPADLPLVIRIAKSGAVVVEDRTGAVDLETHRGDVRVMRCTGGARVATGYGNVIVYDHRGDLDVEVGVGDMQLFVREPGRRLRAITGMGNVQCLIPADVGFRADARTETGKLANGFGLPIERPTAYSAAMTGQRGDGRTEIVMRSGRGTLSLSHKTFD